MNKKIATNILIIVLLGNLVIRLSSISFWSNQLLELLTDNILHGELFQAHVLSPRSSRFWFNLIDCLIPHIIILTTLVGIVQFFKHTKAVNRYLVLTIVLTYFPVLPELTVWITGITNPLYNQYFFYDSTWTLLSLIMYYIGFIYSCTYFIIYSRTNEQGLDKTNVTGNLTIRFKNYFADTAYIMYLSMRMLQLLREVNETNLLILYLGISVFYYIYCEYLFGQSIGKVITNTVVIFSGDRFADSVIRSLARKIPLEPFSFLSSSSKGGWHDRLSKSRLVRP